MPRPDKCCGRVPAGHWSETLGEGGSFPFLGLSFLIRDMDHSSYHLTVAARTAVQKRTLGPPCSPGSCRSPLRFAVSKPRAAPLPPKPATLRPYPPLNPDDTVAGPAAPLPGPVGIHAWIDRGLEPCPLCSQQPRPSSLPTLAARPLSTQSGF